VHQELTAMSSSGRRARGSLLGVPDRLAPILAGETDAAVIHLLSEEIERGLAEPSRRRQYRAPPVAPLTMGVGICGKVKTQGERVSRGSALEMRGRRRG